MLELRNLSKYLLTRKALRKFNKKSPIEITQQRLTILLTLYTMQRTSLKTTFTAILQKLTHLGCAIAWQHLNRHLKQLMEAGLIERAGGLYSLTPKGIQTILAINEILRRERFDR